VDTIKPVIEASLNSIIDALTRRAEEEIHPPVNDNAKTAQMTAISAELWSALESFNTLYLDNTGAILP
jgi:hypothetical protein